MSDPLPPHSPEAFPAPADGPQAPPLEGHQERLWASMAHLLSFAAAYMAMGFLAPLVIYLVFGNRSPFLRAHSLESLNFQLTALALAIGAGLLALVTMGIGAAVIIPLAIAYAIVYIVCVVKGAVRAHRGEPHRYPLTIRFVKG